MNALIYIFNLLIIYLIMFLIYMNESYYIINSFMSNMMKSIIFISLSNIVIM